MFGSFTNKVKNGGAGARGERFGLNEVLAILDMAENLTDAESGKVDKKTIAGLTGRSEHSLNYKIFEGQTTIKGKTNVRSIKKYWFEDPKSKDSGHVDAEVAMGRLFKAYGEEFVGWDDVQARIDLYCKERGINQDETEATA